MKKQLSCLALAAALIFSGTPSVAEFSPHSKHARCFNSRQFDNWKAGDSRTIYIRVNPRRYYRLDLAGPCHAITWPGAFLITKFHSTWICSALDWDLKVAISRHDIPQACIVKRMTELSGADAAALPRGFRP